NNSNITAVFRAQSASSSTIRTLNPSRGSQAQAPRDREESIGGGLRAGASCRYSNGVNLACCADENGPPRTAPPGPVSTGVGVRLLSGFRAATQEGMSGFGSGGSTPEFVEGVEGFLGREDAAARLGEFQVVFAGVALHPAVRLVLADADAADDGP